MTNKKRNAYLRKQGYRSGLEVSMKDWLEQNQTPFKYEEGEIPYIQPEKARKYSPDFRVESNRADGTSGTIILETKGRGRAENKKQGSSDEEIDVS